MKDSCDEQFMRLALLEAKKGEGRTSPNPCVGAIIVKNGRIISKGFHEKAGSPHAEINAINNAVESVLGATIYVTLEPCNHTGRTPPCSRAIVVSGFKRVVVGMTDPNPAVNGSGIDYLRSNGLEVVSGILERDCEEINYPFVKYITHGLPWTIMKAGVSLDGRLNYQRGSAGRITGELAGKEVHRLRDKVDAILVGRSTIEIDNPMLTTRLNQKGAKDPVRVVLDTHLTTPLTSKVYHLDSHAQTFVFCAKDNPPDRVKSYGNLGVQLFQIDASTNGLDLKQVLSILAKQELCSVLVEGGARLHGAFLQHRLFDYANLFLAPIFAGDKGVSLVEGYGVIDRATAPSLADIHYRRVGEDILISGKLVYKN